MNHLTPGPTGVPEWFLVSGDGDVSALTPSNLKRDLIGIRKTDSQSLLMLRPGYGSAIPQMLETFSDRIELVQQRHEGLTLRMTTLSRAGDGRWYVSSYPSYFIMAQQYMLDTHRKSTKEDQFRNTVALCVSAIETEFACPRHPACGLDAPCLPSPAEGEGSEPMTDWRVLSEGGVEDPWTMLPISETWIEPAESWLREEMEAVMGKSKVKTTIQRPNVGVPPASIASCPEMGACEIPVFVPPPTGPQKTMGSILDILDDIFGRSETANRSNQSDEGRTPQAKLEVDIQDADWPVGWDSDVDGVLSEITKKRADQSSSLFAHSRLVMIKRPLTKAQEETFKIAAATFKSCTRVSEPFDGDNPLDDDWLVELFNTATDGRMHSRVTRLSATHLQALVRQVADLRSERLLALRACFDPRLEQERTAHYLGSQQHESRIWSRAVFPLPLS